MTTTRIQQLVDTHEFGLLALTDDGRLFRIRRVDHNGRVWWTKLSDVRDVEEGAHD